MSIEKKTNPLIGLIGTWVGDRGTDIAPKPIIDENNPYYETLEFEVVDIDIENAEEQQEEEEKPEEPLSLPGAVLEFRDYESSA